MRSRLEALLKTQKNTCLVCGGDVAVKIGADGVEQAHCANCGEVMQMGLPGDLDLTKPSPPLFVPVSAPFACLSCGTVLGDADDCPARGAAMPVVFVADNGRRVQGVMHRDDLAKLPGGILDDRSDAGLF